MEENTSMAKIIIKLSKRLQAVEKKISIEINNKNKLNFNNSNFSWNNINKKLINYIFNIIFI